MTAKRIVAWSLIGVTAALLGLEMWLLTNKEKNDTISEVIQTKAKEWLFIPFLFGFLMGHFFWPLCTKKSHKKKKKGA